jgi:hypothetical protein
LRHLPFRPFVMHIPAIKQRHYRSRINENATRHIPSFGSC